MPVHEPGGVDPPRVLIAELTHRCPLHCPYCSNPLALIGRSAELETGEWRSVIDQAAALGVVQIQFSGGEPLARPDLEAMIATAVANGIYPFLSTGGTLATPARLRSLREAGLVALQVSLQSSDPDENDRFAGASSFERKRAAVAAARALDLHVTLNVVIHRGNVARIEEMLALARAWDVQRIELAHVQHLGWAFLNREALLVDDAALARAAEAVARARAAARVPEIAHVLPDYAQDLPKPCLDGWGRVRLTVAPDGAALPCQAARDIPGLTFPSVRASTLRDIWNDAPVFRRFRGTEWMPDPCRGCPRRTIDFGGCRCQAWLVTGDPAATDPVCRHSPHHHRILEARARARADAPLVFRGPARIAAEVAAGSRP
jgi:PqqA peptide cyclase